MSAQPVEYLATNAGRDTVNHVPIVMISFRLDPTKWAASDLVLSVEQAERLREELDIALKSPMVSCGV